MNASSTQALPGSDVRPWVSIAAAAALACALSPLLPLLSIAPWQVVTVTPYVAAVLAGVTLLATHTNAAARRQRALAIAAIAALAVWVALFVLMVVAFLYGS